MRRAVAAVLSTAALALPVTQEVASASTAIVKKKKVVVTTKKAVGDLAQVSRWGEIEVVLTVKKTTTTIGKKKTIVRRVIAVAVPQYPNHTDRSIFINQQALPYLTQEVMQAQLNPNIQLVSGATDTSMGFEESLQSAILKAKKI